MHRKLQENQGSVCGCRGVYLCNVLAPCEVSGVMTQGRLSPWLQNKSEAKSPVWTRRRRPLAERHRAVMAGDGWSVVTGTMARGVERSLLWMGRGGRREPTRPKNLSHGFRSHERTPPHPVPQHLATTTTRPPSVAQRRRFPPSLYRASAQAPRTPGPSGGRGQAEGPCRGKGPKGTRICGWIITFRNTIGGDTLDQCALSDAGIFVVCGNSDPTISRQSRVHCTLPIERLNEASEDRRWCPAVRPVWSAYSNVQWGFRC